MLSAGRGRPDITACATIPETGERTRDRHEAAPVFPTRLLNMCGHSPLKKDCARCCSEAESIFKSLQPKEVRQQKEVTAGSFSRITA